ncbi:MAG TPA: glycosyltransferase family 4 protein [Thermoanaerobaculia bacterium]|nr:glycosyltransferase family 4 protein [Thermoanaerobaculia bacterium]
MTMPGILVTHPGRQHSHQAALALQRAGLLAGYWAGVPSLEEHSRWFPRALRRRLVPYAPVPLDPSRVRCTPWVPGLRRLGDPLPGGAAREIDLAACHLFDRWVARRLPQAGAAGVIACEISALRTFRAARARGITTLLDAPSIHWAAQDRLHGTLDAPGLHRRIVRIKEEEIALADHVLTVSEFARQTYLEAGVPAEKVHAVPLGADLSLFQPGPEEAPRAGLLFLFAGASIHRKGFDLLLEAFAQVAAEVPDARLRVVGPHGDAAHLLDRFSALPIKAMGPTDQRGLAAEFRRADCLVLPSRNDSYAMVVTEALATGLPVIVSEMVGAKDLIREGKNGWIVPAGDAAPLAERMLAVARGRGAVRAMRGECRRSAEAATWEAYYERFVELIRRIGAA